MKYLFEIIGKGINFFDYLSDVLNKAADLPHLTPEACRELLPDKWTKG